MILSVIFTILMGGIAFFIATQGLFSAAIMAVLTLCCAALAVGTHEWVAANWLAPMWRAEFALPVSLALLFGIPLVLVRMGLDYVVRRSPLLSLWIDRAGAALCGLISALVVTGIAAHAVLQVPFDGKFLGFARVETYPQPDEIKPDAKKPPAEKPEERELWFTPDRFAVGAASLLSGGVFSGPQALEDRYTDLVQVTGWTQAVPAQLLAFAPPGSITLLRCEPVGFVYRVTPPSGTRKRTRGGQQIEQEEMSVYEPIEPANGFEFLKAAVRLDSKARDARRSHVFTLRQFVMTGREGSRHRRTQYHAVAVKAPRPESSSDTVDRHVRFTKTSVGDWYVLDTPLVPNPETPDTVEVVFEVPRDFDPEYLYYKRLARVKVSLSDAAPSPAESTPPGEESASRASEPGSSVDRGSSSVASQPASGTRGRARGVAAQAGRSFFGDPMPMPLRAYQQRRNARITRGALVEGHLIGNVDEQDRGTNPEITRFIVPEEKRLLHLSVQALRARSTLGKALSFATGTIQNYFVIDAEGGQYELAGKYAIASVGGRDVIEVQYFSERAGTIGQIGSFDRIRERDLKDDDVYVLLFLVDPGARIVAFSTGGAATRRDDLTPENLVAPE